jgi:hypothetical protein
MALNYPDYVVPQPSQTKLTDLLDLWDQGVAQGKADRYEREAPQQLAQAVAPLSQFGLTMPPDQLRALFANPHTRPLALQMVQEATQRRADAYASSGQPEGTAWTPQPSPLAWRGHGIRKLRSDYRFIGGDPGDPASWERL